MPPSHPHPTIQDLTPTTVKHYLTLYPTVLQRVYKATRPKLNQTEILDDDKWRYETLPGLVGPGVGLEKEQLARLVKWKITHHTNRPFLPSMIAKNDPVTIKDTTTNISNLFTSLSRLADKQSITTTLLSALTDICTLHGVGPATGSLALSVYSPKLVPFFGDEVYNWVVTGDARGKKGGKLKYDRKEYGVFLGKVLDVVMKGVVGADEIERVGYVLGHLDVLSEEEKKGLEVGRGKSEVEGEGEDAGDGQGSSGPATVDGDEDAKNKDDRRVKNKEEVELKSDNETKESSVKKVKTNKMKRPRQQEANETVPDPPVTRRSKRIKK